MKPAAASILLLAFMSLGEAAFACELTDKTEFPLKTRRPVLGDRVLLTSGFGQRFHPAVKALRMHAGVDWAAPEGTPVVAAGDGRVISAAELPELGNTVVIEHGTGWQTVYANLAGFDVRTDDCVKAYAVIGRIGTLPGSGPHLHFEIRREGQPVNPLSVPYEVNP